MFGNIRNYIRLNPLYDVLFASSVIFIVLIILLPIPSAIIDSLLSLSISISTVILIAVLFSEKPLDFSSFPTILLLSTLLRLAINIASTRAILINGHKGTTAAGHIIQTFGFFVMEGSVIVGIIIFSILTIINFIVVTKGAGRIAEVSARFSLDAMPGKQMSIDAELSSGMIDEETAKKKRSELEQESMFFGSMDGASKFVRGDAIAGIIITMVNFVGGSVIGTVEKHMELSRAIKTYTVLTIGDGLVSQIPSLLVSIAAGLLVSKGRMDGSTEKAIFAQIGKDPKSMALAGSFLIVLSLIPGIPMLPFLCISGLMFFSVYAKTKITSDSATKKNEEKKEESTERSDKIKIDAIKIELGSQILSLAEASGNMKTHMNSLKQEFADELGFIIPQVRLQDNFSLGGNEYTIKIQGIKCASGTIYCNMVLVISKDTEYPDIAGKQVVEPVFQLPSVWINEFEKRKAIIAGHTVIEPQAVLIAHLREAIRNNIEDLVTYSAVQNIVGNVEEEYQKMIGEIIPSQVPLTTLQKVIQFLLYEFISIRDIPHIVGLISEAYRTNQNINYIYEYVRSGLAKQICDSYASENRVIKVILLSQKWESEFSKNITQEGTLILPPNELRQFVTEMKKVTEKIGEDKQVIMCKASFRPHVRDIVKRSELSLNVMSQNEIHPKYSAEVAGYI